MKRKRTRVAAFLVALAVMVSFMPAPAFAGMKSMTAYYQIYKHGKAVYCCAEAGLFKVTVTKAGKVKKIKRLEKGFMSWEKKKGKYLYYMKIGKTGAGTLKRVKMSGGKIKTLIGWKEELIAVISGNKIYYAYFMPGRDRYAKKVMKLNGKSKKKTRHKPLEKNKRSNAKGYRIINNWSGDGNTIKSYLKTPKGTYYLGESSM
ncbi:MAG: hypothetical protein IJ109_05980 [Firmicutes bacterium]|nr:hypothetical protein [Bacillota bacterium]